MSQLGYLIPQKKFEVGKFEAAIKAIFENEQWMAGYYDEDNNWYTAGTNANALFQVAQATNDPPFEFVEIHDTVNSRIVPESNAVGAKCAKCNGDIDESFGDVLFNLSETEYNSGQEINMAKLTLECEHCNYANVIHEIRFDEAILLANQYVCFSEINEDFNEASLNVIAEQLNCKLTVVFGNL